MKISVRKLKNSAFNYLGLILYRIILDYCYITIISPIYKSTGLVDNTNTSKYLASWAMLLFLSPFIISNFSKKTLSANVIILFSLISFVPTTSLIAYIPTSNNFILLTFIYWFLLLVVSNNMPGIKLNLPQTNRTNYFFWFILTLLCLTVIYISGRYTHFRFHFGLFDIYELRMEEREFNLPIILKYFHAAANTLLPVILVYFLYLRKYRWVIILSVVILLNFGIGGHKSVILMFVLSFLGYWFYKYNRISYVSWGLVFLSLLSVGEYYFFNTYILSSILIDRGLFIPAQLHFYYYDFFSSHELDYFRQGILRWFFFSSPYKKDIAFIIGQNYFHDPAVRANNGLFSDAYLNLGSVGAVIFPFIIVIILRFLDASAKGLDEKFVFLPILVTSMTLISTSFSIALLTSGLLLMMLTLYFLPRK